VSIPIISSARRNLSADRIFVNQNARSKAPQIMAELSSFQWDLFVEIEHNLTLEEAKEAISVLSNQELVTLKNECERIVSRQLQIVKYVQARIKSD
jgi:hypothetical protein